jgi:hypothetical protein
MARLNNPPKEIRGKDKAADPRPNDRDHTNEKDIDPLSSARITAKPRTKRRPGASTQHPKDADHGDEHFEPIISASGQDYTKRKGVARYIQKKVSKEPQPPRRLPRYVKEEIVEEESDGDDDDDRDGDGDEDSKVLRNGGDVVEELWEGEQRRSKRLAEKKKRGY